MTTPGCGRAARLQDGNRRPEVGGHRDGKLRAGRPSLPIIFQTDPPPIFPELGQSSQDECRRGKVAADLLFTPPTAYLGAPARSAFTGLAGGETLVPSWAKPTNTRSWTLRLHEVAGERGTAQLQLADGWKARKTDLRGRLLAGSRAIKAVEFRPYEIVSLEIFR